MQFEWLLDKLQFSKSRLVIQKLILEPKTLSGVSNFTLRVQLSGVLVSRAMIVLPEERDRVSLWGPKGARLELALKFLEENSHLL